MSGLEINVRTGVQKKKTIGITGTGNTQDVLLFEVLAHPAEMIHGRSTAGLNGHSITLMLTATGEAGHFSTSDVRAFGRKVETMKGGNPHQLTTARLWCLRDTPC